jgi:Lrp/AsnC family leucine-responsive transcriptional regulator
VFLRWLDVTDGLSMGLDCCIVGHTTPEVMNGYYVTGESDFVLMVTARDMEDYERFTRQFFYENHDIKGFKTMVVMDRVKAGFEIPIDAHENAQPD